MSNDESDECGTHDKIMKATYEALCKHGYANLTMQDIADEFDKSKSLLHYHYDTKQDLLVEFIDYLIDKSRNRVASLEHEDPVERLRYIVDRLLKEHEGFDEDIWDFQIAMLELRSQAPYLDEYREILEKNDEYVHDLVADTIRDGIEQDLFHEVDPEETAALILAATDGAVTRRITVGREDATEVVGNAITQHILSDIIITDASEGAVEETREQNQEEDENRV